MRHIFRDVEAKSYRRGTEQVFADTSVDLQLSVSFSLCFDGTGQLHPTAMSLSLSVPLCMCMAGCVLCARIEDSSLDLIHRISVRALIVSLLQQVLSRNNGAHHSIWGESTETSGEKKRQLGLILRSLFLKSMTTNSLRLSL